jgi:hypothetical protein
MEETGDVSAKAQRNLDFFEGEWPSGYHSGGVFFLNVSFSNAITAKITWR